MKEAIVVKSEGCCGQHETCLCNTNLEEILKNHVEFRRRGSWGGIVGVVVKELTKEQARRLFPYRPLSKYAESRFGGNAFFHDAYLLFNEEATECAMCTAPTKNEYLKNGTCPDCDGRSAANGIDPMLSRS